MRSGWYSVPTSAKGSKEEQHSAIGTVRLNRGWDARNPALELCNPTLDLCYPLVKHIVRKRRVGHEDEKQRNEQETYYDSYHFGFLSHSTRILRVRTADRPCAYWPSPLRSPFANPTPSGRVLELTKQPPGIERSPRDMPASHGERVGAQSDCTWSSRAGSARCGFRCRAGSPVSGVPL